MRRTRTTIALTLVSLLAASWGCAGKQGEPDEAPTAEERVQGEPPEREPPDELPKGPPVKLGGEDAAQTAAQTPPSTVRSTPPRPTGEDHELVRESEVERLLRRGPSYVFRVVSVQPVERDGSFRGYRIVDATEAARRIMEPQLEVGDVVKSVNGVPIERPGDYMKAWKKLRERAVFQVEYRRDGTLHEAHWVVDERARQ